MLDTFRFKEFLQLLNSFEVQYQAFLSRNAMRSESEILLGVWKSILSACGDSERISKPAAVIRISTI